MAVFELPTSVIIIDDDESIRNSVSKILTTAGVRKVSAFDNPKDAWENARKNKYQLIILDWNLPQIGGVGLFNRFRQHNLYSKAPIVVITGFLDKKNLAILEEFPLSRTLQKPFNQNELIKEIDSLLKEVKWIKDQESQLQVLINSVKQKIPGAFQELKKMVHDSGNHKMHVMAGTIFRQNGLFEEAEEMLKSALQKKETSIMAVNELGKLYLETGNLKASKIFLKKANEINMDNIERLCNLGSISLEEMDFDKADKYFKDAMNVDHEDEKVTSGKRVLDNITGYLEHATSVPDNLSSLLNTIGISLVKSKDIKKGIAHYNAAMMQVRSNEVKARLAFNIGYAHKRDRNEVEANQWFEKSLTLDPTYDKAKQFLDDATIARISRAQEDSHKEFKNWEDFTSDTDNSDFGYKVSSGSSKKAEEHKKVNRTQFVSECPIIEEYLDMAAKLGIYLEAHLQELYDQYLVHGTKFEDGVKKMIDEENPSINVLKNHLSK